jgi:hypothetical protein
MALGNLVMKSWKNLDDLSEWALQQGFTRDLFGYAIDRVGSNPSRVADELQRHLLMATLRNQAAAA